MWSCSQNSGGGVTNVSNQTLKEAITNSTDQVSTAMNDISSSDGYKVITSGNSNLKSADVSATGDEMFSDSITLADVSGVYEYQDSVLNEMQMHWGYGSYMYNHFKMIADTSLFIIKLPESLAVHHPEYCFYKSQRDTDTLVNNFVITTSKYSYKYAFPGDLSYSLESDIAASDTAVGRLDIEWTMGRSDMPYSYASTFTFASGYAVGMQAERTDTTRLYDYNLSDGGQTLYDEMVQWSKDDGTGTYTKVHSLTIGDVKIVHTRIAGSDSLEIYKGGELQQNATVAVVDNSSENDSDAEYTTFCNKYRDYQITFDDSTTVLLSDLLGPTRDTMSQLFSSMHEMKFATHLVNYIAWNVYYRDKMKLDN
ncbi:hypothetical protein SD074_05970 [Prolixibacter sp. SD074]|nr:hypothetical protein SD074_05970 [Prolixibacter sp. SD074]